MTRPTATGSPQSSHQQFHGNVAGLLFSVPSSFINARREKKQQLGSVAFNRDCSSNNDRYCMRDKQLGKGLSSDMDYCRCDTKKRMIGACSTHDRCENRKRVLIGKHKTKRTAPRWEDNIIPLQPSGHYMYHQFNTHKSYVLPTQSIYMFCVDLRKNSDYFPVQH